MPVLWSCGSLLKELCVVPYEEKEWMDVGIILAFSGMRICIHQLLKSLVDISSCVFTSTIDSLAETIEPNFPM